MERAPLWSSKVLARSAEMFGLTVHDLTGPSRESRLIPARFLAVRALRELGATHSEIGRKLNRDHSTVPNAVRKADRLLSTRPDLKLVFEEIVNAGSPGYFPEEQEDAWLYPWHRPERVR